MELRKKKARMYALGEGEGGLFLNAPERASPGEGKGWGKTQVCLRERAY